ncbi:hypothetical protein F4779DRAFT_633465 [Xylariaceae sp. FL0662B]|nr:hypothetical protein F4779DRAFT_633465 [Xylariaceae sp. FL0662B]
MPRSGYDVSGMDQGPPRRSRSASPPDEGEGSGSSPSPPPAAADDAGPSSRAPLAPAAPGSAVLAEAAADAELLAISQRVAAAPVVPAPFPPAPGQAFPAAPVLRSSSPSAVFSPAVSPRRGLPTRSPSAPPTTRPLAPPPAPRPAHRTLAPPTAPPRPSSPTWGGHLAPRPRPPPDYASRPFPLSGRPTPLPSSDVPPGEENLHPAVRSTPALRLTVPSDEDEEMEDAPETGAVDKGKGKAIARPEDEEDEEEDEDEGEDEEMEDV